MDGRREEGNYRTRQQGEWDGEKKKGNTKVKVFEKNSEIEWRIQKEVRERSENMKHGFISHLI